MNKNNGRKDWESALSVFAHPRVMGMMFLGFSAGLPYMLIFSHMATWLTDIRIPIYIVGFFAWISITFSIKVFWAPIVDVIDIPLLTKRLGHRRSWMLVAQLGIAAGLVGLSSIDPHQHLWILAWFGLLTAFSAATQDICIDAYRIEAVPNDYQAAMASTYMFGYRFAIVISGAGVLIISEFSSWGTAYFIMACLMSVGIITTFTIEEPVNRAAKKSMPTELVFQHLHSFAAPIQTALKIILSGFSIVFLFVFTAILFIFPVFIPLLVWAIYKFQDHDIKAKLKDWYLGAVVGPIVDFVYRFGFRLAMLILCLILIYRVSDLFMGFLANSLYITVGFSKMEIAIYTKVFGIVMTLIGTFMGGIMVMRYGVMKILLLGSIMVAATNLLFTALALTGYSIFMLIVLIIGDNISSGVATAAFVAYLSSLVNKQYTATQYALFSSLMLILGKVLQGFSGVIASSLGFPVFFTIAALTGVPTIFLILYLIKIKHDPRPAEGDAEAEDEGAAPTAEKAKVGRGKLILAYSLVPIFLGVLTVFVLFERGIFQFNHPDQKLYPVRGINISAAKIIDWETIRTSKWNIDNLRDFKFIYFHVTKGDGKTLNENEKQKQQKLLTRFEESWKNAANNGYDYGAVHTFSLCVSGQTQAENFIGNVPVDINALAPVIEIQLVGNCPINEQASTEEIIAEIKILSKQLEANYAKLPILLGTDKAYKLMLKDHFSEHKFWIKSVIRTPDLDLKRPWSYWQYSSRALIEGISGYSNMTVFQGSATDFQQIHR